MTVMVFSNFVLFTTLKSLFFNVYAFSLSLQRKAHHNIKVVVLCRGVYTFFPPNKSALWTENVF